MMKYYWLCANWKNCKELDSKKESPLFCFFIDFGVPNLRNSTFNGRCYGEYGNTVKFNLLSELQFKMIKALKKANS